MSSAAINGRSRKRSPAWTAPRSAEEVGRWRPLGDDLACLADCAAAFECEAEETIERLASAIVVARVRRVVVGGAAGALVRFRGLYDQIGLERRRDRPGDRAQALSRRRTDIPPGSSGYRGARLARMR